MKFNNLAVRASTATIFVLVMAGGILLSPYTTWILFAIVNVFCLVEYQKLSAKLPSNQARNASSELAFIVTIGCLIYSLITAVALGWLAPTFLVLGIPLFFLLFIRALYSKAESPFTRLASNLMSLVWFSVPCALFVALGLIEGEYAPYKLLGIIVLVWISDSFAYFSGSMFGKTPLFKRVSPKKTWEGSLGGLLGTLVVAFILSLLVPEWSWLKWSIIAVIATVLGTIGDLVESLLKRSTNVKDSGTILPGHGGFLDRFDAVLFSTPFIFTFVYLTRGIL